MSEPMRPAPIAAEVRALEERLAGAAPAVPVPPETARADLARGRRRLRRRRTTVTGAVLTVAAVVGLVAVLLPRPDQDVPPASTPGTVATDPAGTPTVPGPEAPTSETAEPPDPTVTGDTRTTRELLAAYRDLIASYLDPRDEHLQAVPDNVQTSGRGLGTKLGWSTAGEEGLGVVEVFVSASWTGQWYLTCGADQECESLVVGRVRAQVLRENGVTWVGVEREDGSVAVVSASRLFGNNSAVPVAGMDVSEADLARAAADPGLALAAPPRDRRGGGRPG